MKKTMYLMRHGQTLFNEQERMQGFCDAPLTPLGIEQAKQAGENFKGINFDNYYCSTSERTSDTLELAAGILDYTRLKGIKEMNFGVFEGMKESEVLPEIPVEERFKYIKNYGGETITEVGKRNYDTYLNLIKKDENKTILCVSHGVSLFAFYMYLLNVDNPNLMDIIKTDPKFDKEKGMPNCIIFKYEFDTDTNEFTLEEVIYPNEI